MNLDEARQLMAQCQRDRLEAGMQAQAAQAKRESANLIIQGLLRRFPELEAEVPSFDLEWEFRINEGPTTSEAILQILQVDERQKYSVRDMVSALEARGILPQSDNPPNVVRAALERLKSQDIGVSKGTDQYGAVAYWYREPEPSRVREANFDEEPF